MKRWVVRTSPLPAGDRMNWAEFVVTADRQTIEHGVLVFERWEEVPVFEDVRTVYPTGPEKVVPVQVGTENTLVLVRAFGVGQWRDVEPLADPEPEHTGVVREPGDAMCECGHFRKTHRTHHCMALGCSCERFAE